MNTKVIDSRTTSGDNCIRRRRECENCRIRFTTYEKSQNELMVIKKSGSREYFNPKKVRESLLVACNKRPVDKASIDLIVENIERNIRKKFSYEVPTSAIGNMILGELKKIDKIAYVRFASVYREFQDLVDFVNEIKTVTNHKSNNHSKQRPVSKSYSSARR